MDRQRSLPLRECGLKSSALAKIVEVIASLPLRECGLKSMLNERSREAVSVTPLAGVWIEMQRPSELNKTIMGHSPCGSVD